MQLRMELDEISMDQESSFEQKNMKREYEKASLAEKKATEEINWLKTQVSSYKTKLKQANEENDELQDKLLELKSSYPDAHGPTSPSPGQGLGAYERDKMQQAIEELTERCRSLREEKIELDAENNFFHMSTTIFIKLKPVMESEKKLCYQLADLNLQSDQPGYEKRRQKLEAGIIKCRDTISVMEVKLKKVLDRVKKAGEASHEKKKSTSPSKQHKPKQQQISSFIALEGTDVIVDDSVEHSGLLSGNDAFDENAESREPRRRKEKSEHPNSTRYKEESSGAVDFTSSNGNKRKIAISTRNRDPAYGPSKKQ